MKKMILYVIPFALILGICMVYSAYWSNSAQDKKRKKEILMKNDDLLLMNEYLSGQFHYKEFLATEAKKAAFTEVKRRWVDFEKLNVSLTVLQKTIGLDSTARVIFQRYHFIKDGCDYDYNKETWSFIDKYSADLSKLVQEVVLKKKTDLMWSSRYLSQEEIVKMCCSGIFEKWQVAFYCYYSDANPKNKESILDKFTDQEVIYYGLGSKISKERMLAIAHSLEKNNFSEAYDFLVNSDACEIANQLALRNMARLDGYDLLWFYSKAMINRQEVSTRIKNLSTARLVKDFPKRTNTYIWSFPFSEYAQAAIKSVKNAKDVEMVFDFISYFSDEESKDFLLNMLSAKGVRL